MRRLFAACALLAAGVWPAHAQSTLDALDQELKEVKQQHDDATAQNASNFFSQVDQAMNSDSAAVALWQQAGGGMPAPTPVTTEYETESASERDAREGKDKANNDTLAALLQVHCGLLHYGALFVTDPKRQGLQDDFNGWLQKMARAYPQLIAAAAPPAGDDSGGNGKHHKHAVQGEGNGATAIPPVNLGDVLGMTLQDSLITKYLSFNIWKDKAQGSWAIRQIPQLFKTNILDPARTTPTEATLAAWDVYIATKQADASDPDKWTSGDYPPLQFDRACDDYAITPSSEKLEVLVQIIHANPTHPSADDWIQRARDLLDSYRASHGGAPAAVQNTTPTAPGPVTNGNVTVTTLKQGDAQVIITHTNSTGNPAPPQ